MNLQNRGSSITASSTWGCMPTLVDCTAGYPPFWQELPVSLQRQYSARPLPVSVLMQSAAPWPWFHSPVEDVDVCGPALCWHMGCSLAAPPALLSKQCSPVRIPARKGPLKARAIRIIALIARSCPDQCIDCPDGLGILIQFRQKLHNPLFIGNRYIHPSMFRA